MNQIEDGLRLRNQYVTRQKKVDDFDKDGYINKSVTDEIKRQ